MAKFSKADSRRMYSWWWDSHISPKNSKWLQENLKDMDFRVKSMIKLIEEDADSFARRADMYFKKRPELMKMVEEFYRAYRSLAERYDHATRVIRHAHLTMAEAFPNQGPSIAADDSPRSSGSGSDSTTSDPSTLVGELADEYDSVGRRKGLSQFSFEEVDEKEEISPDRDSESIIGLKELISKIEAEKEAGISQYQQSLDMLSQLESEMAKTKEDFRVISDHAKKAESEIEILSKKLSEAEAEKEMNLQKYQQSVEKISKLQEDAEKLNDRAECSEVESRFLKDEIEKLSAEKNVALNQYMQLLDKVSNLESKLQFAEEESRMLKERAEKAEGELEVLRETVTILTKEKETAAEKYQHSLDKISGLELKLDVEISSRDEKFWLLEKSNQDLHMELEALMLKMGTQSEELTEKQQEIVLLWASIQEEKQRFVEAESAFKALQHLHSKTQEELQAISSELQQRDHSLKIMEGEKSFLQDEILGVKMENKKLEDMNASFKSSVKELKNENAGLRENWQREISEKSALLQKLGILDRILEKNSALESFLSDLHGELEASSGKIEKLEETLQSLINEKTTVVEEKLALAVKLEEASKNLEQLSNDNNVLEKSIYNAHNQLESLVAKLKNMEESYQVLLNEKTDLKIVNDRLTSQLENVQLKLDDLGKLYSEEEKKCSALVEEKRLYIYKVEEMQLSFEMEVLLLSRTVQELKESNQSLCADNLKLQEDISLVLSKLQAMKELADEEKVEAAVFSSVLLALVRNIMEVNEELRESECRKEVKLSQIQDSFLILQGENMTLYAAKRSLMNEIRQLKEKNRFLEEENSALFDKVLDLENISMIFRSLSGEIMRDLQELNAMLMGKLSLTEESLRQSEIENLRHDAKLQKTEEELKDSVNLKNQSDDENEALIGRLESSMIRQLLYEQKWNELQAACLSYMDQNEDLKTELAAFAPEIMLLKQCISSLENRSATEIKFQHPENEKLEDAQLETSSVERDTMKDAAHITSLDLHDLRARLEVAVKAAEEENDHMIQENADLHSQLDTSRNQLQLLQNEVQNWRMVKPNSHNSETGDSLLTKDIVLDQVTDCSSYHNSNKEMADENQIVELWETSNPGSTPYQNVSISEKPASSPIKELKLNMLEVPKELSDPKHEVHKMSTSERLESDVEKLVNLQLGIRDLKRKFDVIQKQRRGSKAVVEFEAIRGKLEEADKAILKLIDVNGRLMKSINKNRRFDIKSFSMFEVEDGVVRMKKVSKQAHEMSEKILNLQREVQKLGSVIGKLRDDEKVGRTTVYTERKVLLRDFLYGVQQKKEKPQTQFRSCLHL